MKLELHLSNINRHVLHQLHHKYIIVLVNTDIPFYVHLVLEGSEIARPSVCVSIIISLLSKVSCHIAIDDRLTQHNALLYTGMI